MGLLDDFSIDSPKGQGLMTLALGLLDGAGPSVQPRSLGQIISHAGQNAMGAFSNAKQLEQQRKMQDLQTQMLQGQIAARDRAAQAQEQTRKILSGGWKQPAQSQPVFDQSAIAQPSYFGGFDEAAGGSVIGDNPIKQSVGQSPSDNLPQWQQYQAISQALTGIGNSDLAMKYAELADKAKPKFKADNICGVDGRIIAFGEDGSQINTGISEAEKLHPVNLGNRQILFGEYSGKPSGSCFVGLTPEAILNDKRERDLGAQSMSYQTDGNGNIIALPTKAFPGAPIVGKPVIGSDGKPLMGKDAGLNDAQATANLFGSRADAANKTLANLSYGEKGEIQPGLIKRGAESVPLIGGGLGNMFNWTQNDKQQQVEQAQRDFINAVLRRESGAAIAESEFENARRQYFPTIGDSDSVVFQKEKNRALAIKGILAEVPPQKRNKPTTPATES